MTQCLAVLRAEVLYTELLRADPGAVRAGRRGWLDWSMQGAERGATFRVEFEVRANAVWRFGRVFLRCPRCGRLACRVYLPNVNTGLACRRCWGLTYESRQQRNYRAGSRSRGVLGIILSPLAYAMCRAEDSRRERAQAAARRYAQRHRLLEKQVAKRTCEG